MNEKFSFMLEIIQKLGAFQRKHFRTEIEFEEKKGVMDIVSFVDKESESIFRTELSEKYPEDFILGEETYDPTHDYRQHEKLWIVDPLDGTLMYQRGIPTYAPMIAYVESGIIQFSAIYFPEENNLYHADQSGAFCNNMPIHVSNLEVMKKSIFSVSFSTLMKYFNNEKREKIHTQIGRIVDMSPTAQRFSACMSGQIEGGLSLSGGVWDTVPGGFIIQQSGGKVTNFESDTWDIFDMKVLFSNGLLHEEFQKLLES